MPDSPAEVPAPAPDGPEVGFDDDQPTALPPRRTPDTDPFAALERLARRLIFTRVYLAARHLLELPKPDEKSRGRQFCLGLDLGVALVAVAVLLAAFTLLIYKNIAPLPHAFEP